MKTMILSMRNYHKRTCVLPGKRIGCKYAVLLSAAVACYYLASLPHHYFFIKGITTLSSAEVTLDDEESCFKGFKSQVQERIKLPLGPVPDDAIHFVLSDGTARIKPREICSLESAAVHHPDKPVIVNLMSPEVDWTNELKALNATYPNIQLIQLDLRERLNGTPLGGGWLDKGLLEEKPLWKKNYISDIVRMVTLFKYGGVYLDADMLVLKSFEKFRNAIPLETDKHFANGNFMAFDKGHPFLKDVLDYLAAHFQTSGYADNGPLAITRVMLDNHWCIKRGAEWHNCSVGIELLPSEIFNPVHYMVARQLLMANKSLESTEIRNTIQKAYAVHLYHTHTKFVCIHLDESSLQPVSSLVKKNCPSFVASIQNGVF